MKNRPKRQPLSFNPVESDAPGADQVEAAAFEDAALEIPPVSEVQAEPEAPPSPRSVSATPMIARPKVQGFARYAYPVAIAAALAWGGALGAFVLGFQTRFGAFAYEPFQVVVIAALALLPAIFMLLAAYALRQGARLGEETSAARRMADDLAVPTALAAEGARGVMEAMRREIAKASEAATAAQAPLAALRDALAEETARLQEAAVAADEAGRSFHQTLGKGRLTIEEMSRALGQQAEESHDAMARQARLIGDASELAQMQLLEAQASLAARAADITYAATAVAEASGQAETVLSAGSDRLEEVGETLSMRLMRLNGGLSQERGHLSELADRLEFEHERFAAAAEVRSVQLTQAAEYAEVAAQAAAQASDGAAANLRALIAAAADQVRRLAEAAQHEHEAMDVKARETLGRLSADVVQARQQLGADAHASLSGLAKAAEDARLAASTSIEAAARNLNDRLAAARQEFQALDDAALVAGGKAQQAFDARMESARALIEQSAALVDEAGRRSNERIESGMRQAHSALGELSSLLEGIDRRLAEMPESTREKAELVRAAVERGAADLAAAARKTAEETQAIDASFQDRVRRNYDILSEAVRLMGRVAAAADPAARPAAVAPAPPQPTPAPAPQPVPLRAAEPPRPQPEPPVARPQAAPAPVELPAALAVGDRSIRAPWSMEATSARAASYPETATPEALRPAALSEHHSSNALGLRPRLKLTPTPVENLAPTPAEFEPLVSEQPMAVVEAAAPAASISDEWTWKDLLSSLDEPPMDDDSLAERLISEIEALGVDSRALLPSGRIDEIAAVLQTGDGPGAREVVRRLAPSAIRKLSRRVLTDKVLRAQADRYMRRYEGLLSDSSKRDSGGFMTAALLGSDPGRAFLLLDAAVGDLQH